jgi:hypothetical protein
MLAIHLTREVDTSMRLILTLFLVAVSACVHVENIRLVTLDSSNSPVERNVFGFLNYVEGLRESVRGHREDFVGDPEKLAIYKSVLERRFRQDLLERYGPETSAPQIVFYILQEGPDIYRATVFRVARFEPDGAYVRMRGLTYVFKKDSVVVEWIGTDEF